MDDVLWEAEQRVQGVGGNVVGRVEKSSPSRGPQ